MKSKLFKFFNWLDNNILLILSGLLLIFIPLYPKLPLLEVVPGYIVRVRLEDFFVLGTIIIWLIQLLRKRVKLKTPFFALITLYAVIGLLSLLSAIYFTKTIPVETLHVTKSIFHYLRYLEYFSIFLIVFSAIKSKSQFKKILTTFLIAVVAVSFYGVGQKYLDWPVYSTMNREFSKGLRLYLTDHARVQSTFGGHYDFAAFFVISLPIVFTLALKTRQRSRKFLFQSIHLLGIWSVIVSASRTSFVAYLLGVFLVILFLAWEESSWKKRITYLLKRSLTIGVIISIMMVLFGADMQERLFQVLDGYPEIKQVYDQINVRRKETSEWILISVGLKSPNKPPNSISLEDAIKLESVMVSSDKQPSTKPSDVYVDVPDKIKVATKSATGDNITLVIEKERTWSDNAIKYGLSLGIRLDTLWPQAISGFLTNPLLGSGYATLNKSEITQFTEAESTDNNYLRTLGETGMLGFVSFYSLVILAVIVAFKQIKNNDLYISAVAIGFIAASIGLLVNAAYIDVFAASKVAFTYWGLAGIVVASFYFKRKNSFKFSLSDKPITTKPKNKNKKKSTKKFKNI